MKPPLRPTLAQVAELAGVSVASASRALSGATASTEMAAKVRQAATELGYVVDVRARSLKMGRTEQLALSVEDLTNPVYVSIMQAIESVVRGAGFRLLVSATGGDPAEEVKAIQSLRQGYADGLVFSPVRVTPEVVTALHLVQVPVVVVGSLPANVEIDNVRTNSAKGIGLVVRHLVAGRRRAIAFVNGPADTVPGAARAKGYRQAMRAAERAVTAEQLASGSAFSYEEGEKATRLLLHRYRPDAVVCANDLMALGAIAALRDAGLRVPEDVAVVGMDDTEIAQRVTPSLTSVSLGSAERGRLAATMLLDRLADPSRPAQRVTVQPRLVERASSAAAPKRGRR